MAGRRNKLGNGEPLKYDNGTHVISFHIPKALLDAVDRLVEMGLFHNRSEAIRTAIFFMLRDLEQRYGVRYSVREVGYR